MKAACDEILATAKRCGVPGHSLVVLAALSSVLVPNGKSPAKAGGEAHCLYDREQNVAEWLRK